MQSSAISAARRWASVVTSCIYNLADPRATVTATTAPRPGCVLPWCRGRNMRASGIEGARGLAVVAAVLVAAGLGCTSRVLGGLVVEGRDGGVGGTVGVGGQGGTGGRGGTGGDGGDG